MVRKRVHKEHFAIRKPKRVKLRYALVENLKIIYISTGRPRF
jgi:hypothetical protein